MDGWVQISIRLPASLLGEIDAHARRMRSQSQWAATSRSTAIRFLLVEALRRERDRAARDEEHDQ